MIAALGDQYSSERAAIVERMLREYAGTIPDKAESVFMGVK